MNEKYKLEELPLDKRMRLIKSFNFAQVISVEKAGVRETGRVEVQMGRVTYIFNDETYTTTIPFTFD